MHRKTICFSAITLVLTGCLTPPDSLEEATQNEVALKGNATKLGINPAPPPGGAIGGWPAPGSSTALYMARLWDMDVTWAQIEPSPPVDGVHTYVWDRLDKLMDQIIASDMRPMYVLYGTPPWAAVGCKTNYTGACIVYPDNPDHWSAFVTAVAKRYINKRTSRGESPVYEVWNEPNLGPSAPIAYWGGSDDQLVDLHKRAWDAVKAVAQGKLGTVLCCGWNRLAANQSTGPVDAWLSRGGGQFVDAISYHPYPKNWKPSTASEITALFRKAMVRHNVTKPLWATEVGILNALSGSGRAVSHKEQATLISQTIAALRADEVPVILWYAWDESHVGFADSNLLGLHRVVEEAVAAAGGKPTAGASPTCDPATQPAPIWGVKSGACMPACGVIGGTSASTTPCAQNGQIDVGQAYDVDYCCKDGVTSSCDPATQPAPVWGEKGGQCLASCGQVGGTSAFTTPCEQNGKVDAGPAYDVAYCCWDGPPPPVPGCDPVKQPAPQWGMKNGQCLQGCGLIGGTSAFTTPCSQHGKVDAGQAYDVAYCCKDPAGACDPASQPSPQWGVKNGQCLQACGVIGGTSAFTTPCSQHGKLDAGPAYDVDYCCKDPASVCDPVSQPSPQWGVKNGQCLPACGVAGGTSAFTTPCAQNGKLDAGPAYDVAYCCKEICDPATQPSPQWGVKNGQCLQACGLIGGTAAYTTPCSQHGMVDAGPAYDVAYCCK